jgi:Flp pilus assembly protein TadB
VTARYVDLQARLRNWEAQETVLLRLMRKSTSIEDSLKVQRTSQDVQLAIEEIRGQLRVLDNQTQFSTITLTMAESGAAAAKPKELSFLRAWHQAIHAIATVAGALVVGLGYAIPLALIALVALALWLIYRRLRPRVATGGTPSGTA